jgi:hypothetical protein
MFAIEQFPSLQEYSKIGAADFVNGTRFSYSAASYLGKILLASKVPGTFERSDGSVGPYAVADR